MCIGNKAPSIISPSVVNLPMVKKLKKSYEEEFGLYKLVRSGGGGGGSSWVGQKFNK